MENINGHLILLMGPTGSGKGTLVRHVKEVFRELRFAVSCTTRDKREGEEDGREYYFISPKKFQEKIGNGKFLEWAEFSGHKYGTLKSEIIDRLTSQQVVLNEIELQGIEQLLPIIPKEKRTLVYVEAGDWPDLEARAKARAPISDEHLILRKERYSQEVKMKPYADVVLDNTDGHLEISKKTLEDVIQNIFNSINT